MDEKEFCHGTKVVSEFLIKYLKDTVTNNQVVPKVKPGFLQPLMEEHCPKDGVSFNHIFKEFEETIMPGVVHWTSPHFHAYFPTGQSYASWISELLIAGLSTVDVNWEACPSSVELEHIVLNWLAHMMDLPKIFVSSPESSGGGCLQTTSGETTLLALTAARHRYLRSHSGKTDLIAYASEQAHFSVLRATLIAGVQFKALPCDDQGALRGTTLKSAIEADSARGLHPFFLVATIGTTTICSIDNVPELGEICKAEGIWLHVDAAYAGAALICPEYGFLADAFEQIDSFAVGLHKWLCMSYDVVAFWLVDRRDLEEALAVDVIYLKHKEEATTKDFTNMQIGTGRKFRALKVWMTMKNLGVAGLQARIRRHVELGQAMAQQICSDQRFAVFISQLGTLTFRLKRGNRATKALRELINDERNLVLTPSSFSGKYLIRFVVNYTTSEEDLVYAWKEIKRCADMLDEQNVQ